MTTNNTDTKYKCKMFLRDKNAIKLLKPGTWLYGIIVESTGVIFMTPYRPAGDELKLTGLIQDTDDIENEQPLLINVSNRDNELTASGFVNNHRVELPVEIIYMAACYERTPFNDADMQALWDKNVLIIGSGTGGSKIALELARAGIGQIALCDPEKLELANVSRHEGDLFDIGKPKTQLTAERIGRINPAIKVETYPEDIFDMPLEELMSIFKNRDLVVAATDDTAIQLLINELTYKLGIPCVFGGCYEEALGGEVFFTLPGKIMPCLACLRGGLAQPKTNHMIDYSTATGPEDYQGQPGLHSAIDLVTSIEVQVCLGILLRESKTSKLAGMIDPCRNFILIGGMLSNGFYKFKKPFDIFYQPLSGQRNTCPVCRDRNYAWANISDTPEDIDNKIEVIEE